MVPRRMFVLSTWILVEDYVGIILIHEHVEYFKADVVVVEGGVVVVV